MPKSHLHVGVDHLLELLRRHFRDGVDQVEQFPADGVVRPLLPAEHPLHVLDDRVQHQLQLGHALGHAGQVRQRLHLLQLGELGLVQQVQAGHLGLAGDHLSGDRGEHGAGGARRNADGNTEMDSTYCKTTLVAYGTLEN